jgi:hypothetical protein
MSMSSMSTPPMPPPFPVVAPATPPPASAAAPSTPTGPSKPIHIRASGEAPEVAPLPPIEKPEQSRSFKIGVAIAVVLLVIGGGVGGFFAWKHFSSSRSHPTPAPTPKPPSTVTSPPKPVNPPALPSNGTQPEPSDSTAAAGKGSSGTEAPGSTPETPVRVVVDTPSAPARGSVAPTPGAPLPLAPGVTARTTAPMTASDASPAFRAFVANMKITGVFQGSPARAFINGRAVREGEFVDSSLGIIFDSVDPDKKQIVFRDRNDVTISRKY